MFIFFFYWPQGIDVRICVPSVGASIEEKDMNKYGLLFLGTCLIFSLFSLGKFMDK